MERKKIIITTAMALLTTISGFPQADTTNRQLTLQANKPGAAIASTMYGIFFEDINYGADGGLYAEMVENRSFEFPQSLMCWKTIGKVSVETDRPAFDRNPHYVRMLAPAHGAKRTGIENSGFFGMGLKKGMKLA